MSANSSKNKRPSKKDNHAVSIAQSDAYPVGVRQASLDGPAPHRNQDKQRLQKILAQRNLGSRREIETWIEAGRIKVNGKVAKLGDRATESDKIYVDDKLILKSVINIGPEVLLYYKPEGQICSQKDPQNRDSVFDHLPKPQAGRWIMVGRLDLNTSGLLLFTTDGDLANKLMHPSSEIEREYAVRIFGKLTEPQMQELKRGVQLEDGPARFSKITYQGGENKNHWYHIIIKEGRNREVRRVFESINITVSRLIRIRFGTILLPKSLNRGQYLLLEKTEIEKLKKSCKD